MQGHDRCRRARALQRHLVVPSAPTLAFPLPSASLALGAVLGSLPFLKRLNLSDNPLCHEANYRLKVIYACSKLELLDSFPVTAVERAEAVQLFEAKKIEKRMGFGTRLYPWDKIEARPRPLLDGSKGR